ncbi:hypothetical protein C0Q70_05306 [Pomacea canaliculata]|uniref:Uncharacterized protein n=1 Tax=Pomacea canaliculata TaxID=400727 RepID=A0A2T7PKW9_POMCA|nr:hypothetical protein C0Q70_05306 [Pomacea canaliculata]
MFDVGLKAWMIPRLLRAVAAWRVHGQVSQPKRGCVRLRPEAVTAICLSHIKQLFTVQPRRSCWW